MIPLTGVVVIIYNMMAFGLGPLGRLGEGGLPEFMITAWLTITMVSGEVWTITFGDLIVSLGLVALFFEIIRSTHTDRLSIINHTLSLIVFIVALIEFLMLRGFATSAFFFITMMALVDVISGFTVSIITARRRLVAGEHADAGGTWQSPVE